MAPSFPLESSERSDSELGGFGSERPESSNSESESSESPGRTSSDRRAQVKSKFGLDLKVMKVKSKFGLDLQRQVQIWT